MKNISLALAGLLLLAAAPFANAQSLSEFTWVTNSDHTIAITGFTGSESTVSIPSSINNMTVTTIEENAFQNSVDMLHVTIPNTITVIQDSAFYNCGDLESVTIPSSVTNLGAGVFQDCFHVTAFSVDSANPNYTSQNGVLFNKSLTTLIEYPESVFVPTTYTIPNGVTTVDALAFWGCSYLQTLTCPASITSVGDTAFVGCTELTNITFMGNAPKAGLDLFEGDTSVTVYYYSGAKGWGAAYGGVHTVKLTITLPSGSVQVTLTPAGAITAGAKWQVDHGANETSGVTVSGLSVGSHVVSFTTISKWATPAEQTVTVANGQTNKIIGVYTYDAKGNPVVTIKGPKPNQTFSNELIEVAGTATDIAALTGVYVSYDNNGSVPAKQIAGSWSNWSYAFISGGGTHTISVFAADATGSVSRTNSVTYKYIPSAILTVKTNGLGSITPVANARLLAIGTNYTLTAMPKPNWIFSNWVASGSENFVSNSPVLHFRMANNLALTANFVTNVFLAGQGTYNGLFGPETTYREQANSGAVTLTVRSTGALSGKLTIGTTMISLTGQFSPAGAATIVTPRKGLTSMTTTLQLNFADQSVHGTVTDGSFIVPLWGDKEVFSASHPATEFEGYYTVGIGGGLSPAVGPWGDSYGTVTVSRTGAVTFKGSLADGTSVSQMSVVSKDGHWPMYMPLYNGHGSFWSSNAFIGNTAFFSPSASWINETNASKTAAYRAGFTNQFIALDGNAYNSAKALPTGVTLNFANVGWPSTLVIPVDIAANSAVTVANAAQKTNKLTMTITKSTGAITGSFADPTDPARILHFGGVIVESPFGWGGYFLDGNQSGEFSAFP